MAMLLVVVGQLLLLGLTSAGSCSDRTPAGKLELLKMAGQWYFYKQSESLKSYSCGELVVYTGSDTTTCSWSVKMYDAEQKKWKSFTGQSKQINSGVNLRTSFWKLADDNDIFSELIEKNFNVWVISKRNLAVLRTCGDDGESEIYVVISRERGLVNNEEASAKYFPKNLIPTVQNNCTDFINVGGL